MRGLLPEAEITRTHTVPHTDQVVLHTKVPEHVGAAWL